MIWDRRIITQIMERRKSGFTRFMKLMTRAGDGWLYPVLAVWQFATVTVTFRWFLTALFSYIIEMTFQLTIKNLSGRRRPFNRFPGIKNLVAPPDQYSFPSGHTAVATVSAIIFSVGYPPATPVFIVFAALVGFSRVYLGVHYPTDVIVGVLLGIFSVAMAWLLAGSLEPLFPPAISGWFPLNAS